MHNRQAVEALGGITGLPPTPTRPGRQSSGRIPARPGTTAPASRVHLPLRIINGATTPETVGTAFLTLIVFSFIFRSLIGMVLRGAANSILLAATTHTFFNRSNNIDGIAADLLEGSIRPIDAVLAATLTPIVSASASARSWYEAIERPWTRPRTKRRHPHNHSPPEPTQRTRTPWPSPLDPLAEGDDRGSRTERMCREQCQRQQINSKSTAAPISLSERRTHQGGPVINTPGTARPERQQQEPRQESPAQLRNEPSSSTTSASSAWMKTGLVALPIYGLILGFTTRKPQPDQSVDPEGWARFVSSPSYLMEHITSSVIGAVVVIFGTLALGAILTRSRAPRLALTGTILAAIGQTLFMVPGTISTFATPAIGAAYLSGNREVMTIEFSPVLTLITGLALLLTVAGNIILGLAIWRSGVLAKWAGLLWIIGTLIFYVLGAFLGMATTGASLPTQPVGALLMAISSAWMTWTVLRSQATQPPTDPDLAADRPTAPVIRSPREA